MTRRDFAKYWLPVLAWMGLIFGASTDLGSTGHTSRIIRPVLRFFWPDVSEETVHDVQVIVRKAGHISGYAILGMVIWRARQRGFFASGWSWPAARFTEALSILYACSDELHQSFVPTRLASGWDVLIDATGAAAGLAFIWMLGKWRGKW